MPIGIEIMAALVMLLGIISLPFSVIRLVRRAATKNNPLLRSLPSTDMPTYERLSQLKRKAWEEYREDLWSLIFISGLFGLLMVLMLGISGGLVWSLVIFWITFLLIAIAFAATQGIIISNFYRDARLHILRNAQHQQEEIL